jgi:hypothetical protein
MNDRRISRKNQLEYPVSRYRFEPRHCLSGREFSVEALPSSMQQIVHEMNEMQLGLNCASANHAVSSK